MPSRSCSERIRAELTTEQAERLKQAIEQLPD